MTRWHPRYFVPKLVAGAALEWPKHRREAEELCHLLGCLCSLLFVPSAACRTRPLPDFGLFSVFTFFPVAFAGGWGRDLLPGCTTQLCTVLGCTLPVGDKTTGKPARGQLCPLQPSHISPCSSSRAPMGAVASTFPPCWSPTEGQAAISVCLSRTQRGEGAGLLSAPQGPLGGP